MTIGLDLFFGSSKKLIGAVVLDDEAVDGTDTIGGLLEGGTSYCGLGLGCVVTGGF